MDGDFNASRAPLAKRDLSTNIYEGRAASKRIKRNTFINTRVGNYLLSTNISTHERIVDYVDMFVRSKSGVDRSRTYFRLGK